MSQRFPIDGLSSALRQQIRRRRLEKEEVIFFDGEPADYIYYVESGSIQLLHYTESGQTVNHYTVMSGEFIAEVVVIVERYLCTAVVEEAGEVLAIPKEAFIQELRGDTELLLSFFGEVAYRLHMAKVMMRLRSIRSAQERALDYLRVIAGPGTNIVVLDRSYKQMARDLDLTPETLSRVIAQLQEKGEIRREERRIILRS